VTYIMSPRMYWYFISELKLTHQEVIQHVNSAFGLRGTVEAVHISGNYNE
jgi:hypothetical protein